MVTCNICGNNKPQEEMQPPFRYVCKYCWGQVDISFVDEYHNRTVIDPEDIY